MKKFAFIIRPDGSLLNSPYSHTREDLARFLKSGGYEHHTDETIKTLHDFAYKEPTNYNIVSVNVTFEGSEERVAFFYALPEKTFRFLLTRWGGLEGDSPDALITKLDEIAPAGYGSEERAA